ncbi:MAG: hypothetical protein HOP15_06955 [Planctomycetes bacterium]|nr:hypothetical protein [Planctomycetota bacterium]
MVFVAQRSPNSRKSGELVYASQVSKDWPPTVITGIDAPTEADVVGA